MGDYNYYLGGEDGKVYTYSDDYLSDDGQPITCTYMTKQLDFVDQYKACNNKFKTIYKVKLLFEDLSADVDTIICVSLDGGATWSCQLRAIGSGDGIPCSENYWFIETSDNFMFKIIHSSDDKSFLWNGLEVDFLTRGDYMET